MMNLIKRKSLSRLLIFVIISTTTYIAFSFIVGSFDFFSWERSDRSSFITGGMLFSVMASLFFIAITEQKGTQLYVHRQREKNKYDVGYYRPNGSFEALPTLYSRIEKPLHVAHLLNGGNLGYDDFLHKFDEEK